MIMVFTARQLPFPVPSTLGLLSCAPRPASDDPHGYMSCSSVDGTLEVWSFPKKQLGWVMGVGRRGDA